MIRRCSAMAGDLMNAESVLKIGQRVEFYL